MARSTRCSKRQLRAPRREASRCLKDSLTKEALSSWAAYKVTGRHLTDNELCDWLETWGGDAETKAPDCHD